EEIRPFFACLRSRLSPRKLVLTRFGSGNQRGAFSVSTKFDITDRQRRLLVSTLIQHYRPRCGNTGAQKAGLLPHEITTWIDATAHAFDQHLITHYRPALRQHVDY